jgi:hypothetical protein
MAKFKVGDLVIGNKKASCYGITGTGWIGTVIAVYGDDDIEVKNDESGNFRVEASRFDLIECQTINVLLRDTYKWTQVYYIEKKAEMMCSGRRINPVDIVAIDNDIRPLRRKCSLCGTIINDTTEAIEQHINIKKSSEHCMTCKHLNKEVLDSIHKSLEKNDDGTCKIIEEQTCNLECGFSYRHPNIFDGRARASCKYANCTEETLLLIQDTHQKYPGAFDTIATVDALSSWNFQNQEENVYIFKARKRFTLTATVNQYGIIKNFTYWYDGFNYEFVYSKKYNKLFWIDRYNNDYSEDNVNVSNERKAEILNTVSEIYKGE